jgi:hypothetical protein
LMRLQPGTISLESNLTIINTGSLNKWTFFFLQAILLLGIYLKEIINDLHKDLVSRMFIIALYNHKKISNNLHVWTQVTVTFK